MIELEISKNKAQIQTYLNIPRPTEKREGLNPPVKEKPDFIGKARKEFTGKKNQTLNSDLISIEMNDINVNQTSIIQTKTPGRQL